MSVQLVMTTPKELVEALATCLVEGPRPLVDYLETREIVTPPQRQMLDGLLEESLHQS
jgi:hypothetical protein